MITTVGLLTSEHIGRQAVITEQPTRPEFRPTVYRGVIVHVHHMRRESWITGQETPGGRVTWVTIRGDLPVHGAPKSKRDRPLPLPASTPVEVLT